MKIEYNFTLEDWLNFSVFHAKHDVSTKKIKRRIGVIYPIIMIVLGTLITLTDKSGPFIGVLLIILGVSFIFIGRRMDGSAYRNSMKKMIESGDNSEIICKHILEFNKTGIVQTLPNSVKNIKWQAIKKTEENESYYFLYENAIAAYIIPKSAINDLFEFDNFIKGKI